MFSVFRCFGGGRKREGKEGERERERGREREWERERERDRDRARERERERERKREKAREREREREKEFLKNKVYKQKAVAEVQNKQDASCPFAFAVLGFPPHLDLVALR